MKKYLPLIFALLLAACTTAIEPTTTPIPEATATLVATATIGVEPSPTPWPVVTLASGLAGSFSTTISIDELRAAGVSEHELCENAGTFTLTFIEGVWTSHQETFPNCTVPLHPDGEGEFTLQANQVGFYDPSSFGCSLRYTYQANMTDTGVIFSFIEDPDCLPRTLVFTLHPWIRE